MRGRDSKGTFASELTILIYFLERQAMSNKRHHFQTNFSRMPEYTRKIAGCTAGIHFHPASYCSVCNDLCRSIPFVMYDDYGEIICDSCADALSIPALRLKQLYDASLEVFEGLYEISEDITYHWRIAIEKRPKLKIDFHTRALIETMCDRCAAYGLDQAYIVCLSNTPVVLNLTSAYHNDTMAESVFKKIEPELLRILETAQSPTTYIEYFYLFDAINYTKLYPEEPVEQEPDLPSWDFPITPKNE